MADIRRKISDIAFKLKGITHKFSDPLNGRLKALFEALTVLVAAIDSGNISAVHANEILDKLLAALDELWIAMDSATDAASTAHITDHLTNIESILNGLGVDLPEPPGLK